MLWLSPTAAAVLAHFAQLRTFSDELTATIQLKQLGQQLGMSVRSRQQLASLLKGRQGLSILAKSRPISGLVQTGESKTSLLNRKSSEK